MRKNKPHKLITVILVISILALAAVSSTATNVSIFDIQSGVRQLGMGAAFTGLADDGYALYYNPAGFAYLDGMSAGFFYSSELGLYGNSELHFASKYYGVGLNWMGIGKIQGYDSEGEPTDVLNYGNFGFNAGYGFAWSDIARMAGFLPSLPLDLSLGGRLKYYTISGNLSGVGWAIDQSFLFKLGNISALNNIRLGLTFSNLLSSVSYDNDYSESWGIGMRIGGSFTIRDITPVFDFELLRKSSAHLGVEFVAIDNLLVRAGMMFKSVGMSFTTGFGYYFSGMVFDYAYASHPIAPATHRLSLSIDIGSFNPGMLLPF